MIREILSNDTLTRVEVLRAADILERLSVLYEAFSPEHYPWSPKELRVEAEHVEEPIQPRCPCGLKERPGSCGWCEE